MIAPSPRSTTGYLDRLNEAQRSAVLHGEGQVAGPLLVIAGAGTGKTSTLAHRVAHLILAGADPRRMLLMTFSRRAAQEMIRRIERIAGEVLGATAAAMIAGLTWAGTFHGIGVRVLREHAPALGLDPAFTVHDRGDSGDLMNRVRHQLGFSQTESRFPGKGTCLAIYSRAVNGREDLEPLLDDQLPLVRRLGGRAEGALRRLRRGQAGGPGARFRRPAALLGGDARRPGSGRSARRRLRPCVRRRVPGHQPAAGGDPAATEAGRARPDRRRRRRPGDLQLPGGAGAQHPRLPRALRAAGARRHPGAELSFDRAHPRCRQRRHRRGAGALRQGPLDRAALRGAAAARHRPRRHRAGRLHLLRGPRGAGGRHAPEGAGGALPCVEPQRLAGDRAHPAQHPLREVRRPEVPRSRARQGPARHPALRREPARPGGRLPGAATHAGDRSVDCRGHPRRSRCGVRRGRRPCCCAGALAGCRALACLRGAASRCCGGVRRAGRPRSRRPASGMRPTWRIITRTPRFAPAIWNSSSGWRRALPHGRASSPT